MKKFRDLMIITGVYLLAFVIGYFSCFYIENVILKFAVFDLTATVVTFIFSLIFKNSSVYDAYWSLTPMVMSIWLFISMKAFSVWHILFLVVFNIWSVRLTGNWCIVFTDFSYEDWRYTKFRNENGPFMWFIINFFGIHLVPTIFVFLGMLPLFEIVNVQMNALSLIGMAVILCGVLLEILADHDMHKFLMKKEKTVCREGLWNFSRHPNYLGEITVWLGVYLSMLPFALNRWYYVIGFLVMVFLFNVISIPMMEKRQLQRRPDYVVYKKEVSRLLLLPNKKR